MHYPENPEKKNRKDKKTLTKDPTAGKDTHNDHTGTDKNADNTETDEDEDSRYDKPRREEDPDTTEIDTNADKTKTDKKNKNGIN